MVNSDFIQFTISANRPPQTPSPYYGGAQPQFGGISFGNDYQPIVFSGSPAKASIQPPTPVRQSVPVSPASSYLPPQPAPTATTAATPSPSKTRVYNFDADFKPSGFQPSIPFQPSAPAYIPANIAPVVPANVSPIPRAININAPEYKPSQAVIVGSPSVSLSSSQNKARLEFVKPAEFVPSPNVITVDSKPPATIASPPAAAVVEEKKVDAPAVVEVEPEVEMDEEVEVDPKDLYPQDRITTQWSPWNQQGPKSYTKDFMYLFKPFSDTRPDDFGEELDKFLQAIPSQKSGTRKATSKSIKNDYRTSGTNSKGKIFLPSAPKPLVKSENRWKPHTATLADSVTVQKEEELLLKAQGHLNKIAPQTYDSLSIKFIEIANELGEAQLEAVVSKIFAKALLDPTYNSLYANLCKKFCEETTKEDGKLVL